ncbi:signal peptide peptidase SppA [Methyloceanibacter sp.]|uniref:signal peptide peptidase SppA n=1 Tax=Methyloceanibacter sp. TaxID=1965321 RepID=UPI0020804964|nr:signal peptide peptidase SppA [Methyloceanibacter sp.]GFO80562.1 MAG: protease [Methyloceanibacter sp.]HML91417.1 signal peptide peptidase SppA [Methyloceanibacter sp.]
MNSDAESIVERRRLKRRISLWRLAAVILGVLFLAIMVMGDPERSGSGGILPHVARVDIDGVITNDRKVIDLLDRVGRASQVRAVILEINSPGGTTTGGEALYDAIRRLAEKKPVVASCGTLATSAAYIVALATDRIFVYGNTITGSVGVIFQWANVTELMKTLGIKFEDVKSGTLKAVPSPFEPTTEEARAVTEEMVDDAMKWFVGLVKERRDIEPGSIPGLTEGRIYSGRQAVGYKLADEIGDERAARAWLVKERGIPAGLRIRQWRPREDRNGILGLVFDSMASALGVSGGNVAALLDRAAASLELDGLVSVWHPAGR